MRAIRGTAPGPAGMRFVGRGSIRAAALAAVCASISMSMPASGAATPPSTQPAHANGFPAGPQRSDSAQPGQASPRALPSLDRVDPVRYSLTDAVRETVEVVNRSGTARIFVKITRPRTAAGVRVPVILQATPYSDHFGRFAAAGLPTPPMYNDEYFVPRGYAVAVMDVRGTGLSTGCQMMGSREEVQDAVDVIDWLAEQAWSSGRVGMTGPSYDGGMTNGAAVEQVLSGRHPKALRAVVPLKAISRYYDHLNSNGVPLFQGQTVSSLFIAGALADPHVAATPRELALTAERRACASAVMSPRAAQHSQPFPDADSALFRGGDYVHNAHRVQAAVFLLHGLFDFNVHPTHALNMWTELPQNAPKKLWLYNGEHANPFSKVPSEPNGFLPFPFRDAYFTAVHRWWGHYLKGIETGALSTPTVEVQGPTGRWFGSRFWPLARQHDVLQLRADGTASKDGGTPGVASWTDTPADVVRPSSSTFITPTLKRPTRLSGQVLFDLKYKLQGPDTSVSVRIELLPAGVAATAGSGAAYDSAAPGAVTLGWGFARAAYRDSTAARGASTPRAPRPVDPGELVRARFGSSPLDVTVPAGSRLRLTFAAYSDLIVSAATGGEIALQVGSGGSSIGLPVVG